MGRKIQVCALSLIGAFGYTTSAFAQAAPATDAPAAAPAAAEASGAVTTEPAPAAAPPAAPAPAPEPPPPPPPPPPAPTNVFDGLKIESKNGSATLKLGMLLQPQYEAIGSADAAHTGTSNNLFLRRTRLLVGGTLFNGDIEYFFDTDSPNLFKADASGAKTSTTAAPNLVAPDTNSTTVGTYVMNVQDAFATGKLYKDMLKIDAGYMLTPGAHNALQGAGTLLGLDYFSNSFVHTNSFNGGAPVGRDAGVELRGLLVDNHIEYRAGLFQGLRKASTATEVSSQNMFRVAGRVQINILDAETGFFYGGTYLGKKKILSVGGAIDFQDKYMHYAFDGFLDMPAGPGNVTAQVNYGFWNGGTFIPALAKQSAIMAEAGYKIDAINLAPIVKFEQRMFSGSDVKETRFGGGLAFFPWAHNINLKAFFTNIKAPTAVGAPSHSYNQFQLQWQLYFY